MPKLITTRTHIADQGKPRTIKASGGLGETEVARGMSAFDTRPVLNDTKNHHFFQSLPDKAGASSLVYHYNKHNDLNLARPEGGVH
jgi:hypothetical protein